MAAECPFQIFIVGLEALLQGLVRWVRSGWLIISPVSYRFIAFFSILLYDIKYFTSNMTVPANNLCRANEELQSKTIDFLRFPLIVGVVLAHSNLSQVVIDGVNWAQNGTYPVYTLVSYLFSGIISRVSIPLFFFISGFLFYYKTPVFTGNTYLQKLKKRVRTILVPYLFWNLAVLAFFFLSQSFLPGLMSGNTKLISEYTFSDWLWAFWDKSRINSPANIGVDAFPICYQLWFLRDLMVVMLFSPLIYFLLKKLRQFAVIGLGILWLFDCWFDVTGFSITAFFFFSAGAFFSVYKMNFVDLVKPLLPWAALFYALFAFIELFFRDQYWSDYLHLINYLVGIVLAFSMSAFFIRKGKWRVNAFLSDSSFFIYAYHGMPLALLIKSAFIIVRPHTGGMMLVLYVLCPFIVIVGGLFFYFILKKYLPGTTALITGGR